MLRLLKLSKRSPIFQYGKFSTSVHIKTDTLEFAKHSTPLEIDKFAKGKVIHGFIVEDVARVEEMYLDAIKLTHLNTRAQYLHLARDDTNNVFCTAFRTTPMDSTGSPHILEHTILCGSERYPCRDPFFKMLRRSLATFINAMTGPDYTMYPFSTQNLKDFQNLQSVYLDSVFRPLLRELDFRQEGWRLEHADVHDKNSPIVFKGVVFNEMKGVFLENQSIFAEKLLNTILPSHTYAFISGGDPLVIPQLEYQDFLNFHKTHYHPSNARFYSYGNFPLENHLKFINDRYLFFADHIDTSSTEVPSEKRWTTPKKEHVFCRPDPMIADPNRQGCIAIGQLCTDITDIQTNFELYVLSQLLLKGPNSAFYKSLVDTNVGTGFGPVTGFDTNCKDSMFVVSLQGVELDNFDKVENIYNDTAANVIEKGFDKDHIEAVLHNIELSMKHQVSNFGLHLLFNLTPLWNHNGDVIRSMRITQAVEKLRENLKEDPKYLQRLVEKYLLKNSHRLTLTMSPDAEFENKRANAERELLEAKLKDLTEEDKERIYLNGLALLADQEKKEDSSMLPTLNIQDLKADVDRYEHTDLNVRGIPLQLSIQPTNGVSYYRGIINTKELSSDLKYLLPVFNNVISKMGTQNYDYRSFDRMIELKTGGLHFVNHVIEHKSNKGEFEEGVFIESHCLDRNMNDMWKIWTELFNNVKLTDLQRFDTLTKIQATDLVNGIADAGHNYAMTSAASLISPIANRKENLSGLRYVKRMKKLAQLKDLSPVLSQIQEISHFILNKNHFRTAINTSKEHKDELINGMEEFYNSLEGSPKDPYLITKEETLKEPQESGIHHVLPYNVNYCSKALSIPPYKDPEYPVLQVLAKILTSIYLLPEVREKGGAYGAGALTLPEGIFTFYSYRDPHSTRTMDLFDSTYDFLTKYEFPERDINEAKLGVFQKVDAPVSPGDRGMAKFIHNLTYDDIQKQRERLKAVDKDQLIDVVEKYLKPNQSGIKIGRSLIGSHNPDLSAKYSQNWTIVDQEEETQARMAT